MSSTIREMNFVIMDFMPKESYFNAQNIDQKAAEISQGLPTYRENPRIPFSLRSSALLILDMQRYFLEPSSHAFVPSARAILPGIQALVQAYNKQKLPIIFTRHTNTEQDAGIMKRWWRDLIQENTPFSKLAAELDPTKGTVVRKSQYDAFYQTTLEETAAAAQRAPGGDQRGDDAPVL